MGKKRKKTVWHKKKGKFLPSAVLRPHGSRVKEDPKASATDKKRERMKSFAKTLSAQIKKAVKDGSS